MKKRNLTRDDLSKEQEERILHELHSNKQWKSLIAKRDECQRRRLWVQAMKYSVLMKEIEQKVFDEMLAQCEKERVSVASLLNSYTIEERFKMEVFLHGIVFFSDIINALIKDVRDLLHKYHPDCDIDFYDTLQELSKAAQEHIHLVTDGTSFELQENYADYVQVVEDFALKKVGVFLKKQQRIRKKQAK